MFVFLSKLHCLCHEFFFSLLFNPSLCSATFTTPSVDKINPILHFSLVECLISLANMSYYSSKMCQHVMLTLKSEFGLTFVFSVCCRYPPPAFLLPTMNW